MAAYDLVLIESGRQDSNLRPSAPKALISYSAALGFQALTIFLRSVAYFLKTNHEVFDHYLTTFSKLHTIQICINFGFHE